MPDVSSCDPVVAGILQRWPYDDVEPVYEAQLPEEWEATSIGALELGTYGLLVLLVDPPRNGRST